MKWLNQLFSRRLRYDELSETIREYLDEKIADMMDNGMTLSSEFFMAIIAIIQEIHFYFGLEEPRLFREAVEVNNAGWLLLLSRLSIALENLVRRRLKPQVLASVAALESVP